MVTPNNYMFRPLTGHYQVVHSKKRVEGCTMCNVTSDDEISSSDRSYMKMKRVDGCTMCNVTSDDEISSSDRSYIAHCTALNHFH